LRHIQGGAELVAFQKKQLINKIKYLNKENQTRDQHAAKLDARIRRFENALSTINQHWDQVSFPLLINSPYTHADMISFFSRCMHV
jgi:hypothetical protein